MPNKALKVSPCRWIHIPHLPSCSNCGECLRMGEIFNPPGESLSPAPRGFYLYFRTGLPTGSKRGHSGELSLPLLTSQGTCLPSHLLLVLQKCKLQSWLSPTLPESDIAGICFQPFRRDVGDCLCPFRPLLLLPVPKKSGVREDIPRPAGGWLVTRPAWGGGGKGPPLRSPKLLDRFPNFKRHSIALYMNYPYKVKNLARRSLITSQVRSK